ncbi:MAG TPA: hypothetical protein VHP58_02430 [Alphaproteobacteria bacterium]|nr:hypothetical protein [Alphaproteobacteria bacterium]
MSAIFPPLALTIVEALKGHDTRAVGGWVRALLRGESMAGVECDLATTATPDQMAEAFTKALLEFGEDGRRWGTLVVRDGAETIEVTTLRQDSYKAGSRYPDVQWTTDWNVDAPRRDFTFNAIYMGADGTAFDPFNGQNDLAGGIVRFIGEPNVRLSEDPLRWLRFWRFCGRYGLAGYTDAMKEVLTISAPALRNLSRHRVAHEWEKLQHTAHASEVLKILRLEGWQKLINERLGHGSEI